MSRLAQLVERKTLNLVVVGSSPTVGVAWSYSVMVITKDFESFDPGSSPGRTCGLIFFFLPRNVVLTQRTTSQEILVFLFLGFWSTNLRHDT